MKILQVIHYFPPSGLGGSELHTYQLSKELLKFHDVRLFFTIPDGKDSGTIEQGCYDGIPYRALKKEYCTYDLPFQERSRWVEQEFSRMLESFKPDIIHFQHLSNLSLALPALANKAHIPCCFTLHDFWLLCPQAFLLDSGMKVCDSYSRQRCADCVQDRIGYYAFSSKGLWAVRLLKNSAKRALNFIKKLTVFFSINFWRVFWVRQIFKTVHTFIAPSRFVRENFAARGLLPQKIMHIPHGVSTEMLSGIKKSTSPVLRFAFIGAMASHKGIDVLMDAFNGIAGPHELRLYGRTTTAEKDDLGRRITNPHIHIMGELKPEYKAKAFSEIDVLIVPSICYESYSLVVTEAFLAKIPVIVSDRGALAERVQDGMTGLIFPAGDSAALAQRIELFIKDRALTDRIAAQIPAVKDIETYAGEIVQVYNRILSPC